MSKKSKGTANIWETVEHGGPGNIPTLHSRYDNITYHVSFTVNADEIRVDRQNAIEMACRQTSRMLTDQISRTEVRY